MLTISARDMPLTILQRRSPSMIELTDGWISGEGGGPPPDISAENRCTRGDSAVQ